MDGLHGHRARVSYQLGVEVMVIPGIGLGLAHFYVYEYKLVELAVSTWPMVLNCEEACRLLFANGVEVLVLARIGRMIAAIPVVSQPAA